MGLPFFIARRHLFSRHKIGYISFIGIIATIGLGVGLTVLILTVSILNGFENEIKTKLLSFDAHIRLRLMYQDALDSTRVVEEVLNGIPEIKAYVPYIHAAAMIRKGSATDGIIIEGLRENDLPRTLDLGRFIRRGAIKFDLPGRRGIVIGEKLARQLDAELGSEVYLFVLQNAPQMFKRPRIMRFTVTGIYSSGIAEYDDIFVYTSLTAAQDLFDMAGQFSGFQIFLQDNQATLPVTELLNSRLGYPYQALSWHDLHANLFDWLRIQRFPILIIFGLIAVVAVFNIVSSLMMIVIKKTRDIGVLKSLGLSNSQVQRIFFWDGLMIGSGGVLLGFCLSLGLAFLQNRYGLIALPEDVYFMSRLPVQLEVPTFLIMGVAALGLALLAAIYPALKALRLTPTEATRYE